MKHALLLSLLFASTAFAQQRDPAAYVQYLVPVLTGNNPLPGLNGARWTATLRLRNDGPKPLDVFPLGPDCFCCADCLRLRGILAPNEDGFGSGLGIPGPIGPYFAGTPGLLLYVASAAAEQFSAHLEVADVNQPQVRATTIPVVPVTAFFTGAHSIIDVPIATTSRVTLRVYQSEPRAGAAIAIRVHEYGTHLEGQTIVEPVLLAEGTFAFEYDAIRDQCMPIFACPPVPYHPGYVEVPNLLAQFPQIGETRSQSRRIRIEFEPADPNERYWPMATVTDNTTNDVQLFTAR